MPSEPHCVVCMGERAVGGITYRMVGPMQWNVVYDGRPTDTDVFFTREGGDVAWLVIEMRETDGESMVAVDVYGYQRLTDFERAYIARDGRERSGGGKVTPTADTGGDTFPT